MFRHSSAFLGYGFAFQDSDVDSDSLYQLVQDIELDDPVDSYFEFEEDSTGKQVPYYVNSLPEIIQAVIDKWYPELYLYEAGDIHGDNQPVVVTVKGSGVIGEGAEVTMLPQFPHGQTTGLETLRDKIFPNTDIGWILTSKN